MKKTVAVTESVSALTLKLPPIFDIKPAHVVALPGGCVANVYDTEEEERHYDSKGKPVNKKTKAWRVIVVNKNGRTPRAMNGYRNGSEYTSSNPLNIRRHIESAAWALSKVKVTTVQEEDGED